MTVPDVSARSDFVAPAWHHRGIRYFIARIRRPLITGLILTTTVFAGCSSDAPPKATPTTAVRISTTTAAPPTAKVKFSNGPSSVVGTGGPAALAAADEKRARQVVQSYINVASWAPLSGQPSATKLSSLISSELAAYLEAHPDDALVFGDQVSTTKATAMSAKVTLHAIMNPDGTPGAIAAEIATRSTNGRGSTKRSGELLLRPFDGTWHIIGFQLAVTRDPGDGSQAATTTTKVAP